MGELLTKAGLLVPYLFAAMRAVTTTIRRTLVLVVEDGINFENVLGRKSTLQYDYFRHRPVSVGVHENLC